ncbi:MAG: serine hydrolase [Oscillospiraceae bacterium]|nr:serine hydrolase [Oscillospiraceae bacterium]
MAHRVLAAAAFAALLALPMTGCGATAVRTEPMATGESALTIGSLSLNPSSATKDRLLIERLEEENAHQRIEQLTQTLDAFCAAQPGSFSVYLQDLTSGEEYTYQTDTLYYPASTLKAPYALWLCQRDDAGEIDLDTELPNQFQGRMAGTALERFNDSETIPAWEALRAMIVNSDNNAVTMLTTQWTASEESGFADFLARMGFSAPNTCSITPERRILGMAGAADLGHFMAELYAYFDTGTENAEKLEECFLDADHDILYVPAGIPAAKKYGSWDYAYHDAAIVYAQHPYILVCMTDQGDADVDFPPQATAAMQELGRLVYEGLND